MQRCRSPGSRSRIVTSPVSSSGRLFGVPAEREAGSPAPPEKPDPPSTSRTPAPCASRSTDGAPAMRTNVVRRVPTPAGRLNRAGPARCARAPFAPTLPWSVPGCGLEPGWRFGGRRRPDIQDGTTGEPFLCHSRSTKTSVGNCSGHAAVDGIHGLSRSALRSSVAARRPFLRMVEM